MANTKQGGSGRKNRKPGDWIAIAKARANSGREVVHRGDRDIPGMNEVGSAAYRRLTQRKAR